MLGEYYHVGDLFVVIYAVVNLIGQFSVMVLSIDAPLRMLLDSADEKYIPKSFFKQNKYGTYTNGHKLVLVIVSILIIVPVLGIQNVDTLVKWLVKVNSVCMPLRYLWVFAAESRRKVLSGISFCQWPHPWYDPWRMVLLRDSIRMYPWYLVRRSVPAGT